VEAAFWDTSALVPLCIPHQASARLHTLYRNYSLVVWWATSVEAQSAFARDMRAGILTGLEFRQAQQRLENLRDIWLEVQPVESLRSLAEVLLERYPLRAADALQLAAAYTWSGNRPFCRRLISGDTRLLEAAEAVGFRVIQVP
jgi:predicted nucleic acid-binding protein